MIAAARSRGHAAAVIFAADEVARAERLAALADAAVVAPVARLAPDLSPTSFPLCGGQVVLLGPGLYVNRGLALGLGVETTTEDLDLLEASSREVGVEAEVDVTPLAHRSLLQRTAARGYAAVGFRSTLLRPLGADQAAPTGIVTVEEVADDAGLAEWQAAGAAGFGYTSGDERRISDLYTTAISTLEQTHLYVARMAGEPVAVAALTIRDDVGILGGMATVPSARGLGVQTDLIRFRLTAAFDAGCRLAMSTAAPGGASERNLVRGGFSIVYTTLSLRRAAPE